MKRKRIIAALLTGTMLCSSIMEPRAMDLSDWSTSSYGRGMQWKKTGIWTARKPQEICMKLITRNIMQTLHGIALLSHQITT